MDDLAATAESLLKSLGLTFAQATVVSTGSDRRPKLLVYVFDKSFPVEGLTIRNWDGIPVEFARMKRFKPFVVCSEQFATAW